MKILQVCDYYQPLGGTESYVLNLSCDLEKLGHKISVMYAVESEQTVFSDDRGAYFFPALIEGQTMTNAQESEIRRIIDKENPDIIYIHNINNASCIRFLTQLRRTVRFIHDHRVFCPKGDKFLERQRRACPYPCGIACFANAYANRCLPRDPRKTAKLIKQTKIQIKTNRKIPVIAASNYMKGCLVQNGFRKSNIKVIPYYASPAQYGSVFFKDFIVFAGRVHQTKGLQFLLPALAECPPNIKLLIIGDGAYSEAVKTLVSQLQLEERVSILGRLSQQAMAEFFINCMAVVMPSRWPEPFGITGIEAMSYKKPVIATNVGGISDWLKDGHNGFLVDYGKVDKLTEKINFLFCNQETAKTMGEKGYQMFLERFSKHKHIYDLLSFFNELST